MKTLMLYLRSLLFLAIMASTVLLACIAIIIVGPFSRDAAFPIARAWCRLMLRVCRTLCGLGYRVSGIEHIPDTNSIVLIKHSSTWETLAELEIFPRQTWVLKHELMWAPFVGWALYFLRPIAIDRRAHSGAVRQVVKQGKERLEDDYWVMLFPEGTRMPPGETRRYGLSGALLASETGRLIVPVAHNAGDFWGRRSFVKFPGTIDVVIGPAIESRGRNPKEINAEAQDWIEKTMKEISAAYR